MTHTSSQVTLGDAIVWWRVCVLSRKKSLVILGALLTTCTLGTSYFEACVGSSCRRLRM